MALIFKERELHMNGKIRMEEKELRLKGIKKRDNIMSFYHFT